MKKHAIIPIFIPHLGCPCKCVFCNQQKITAKTKPVTIAQVHETVEKYLSTLGNLKASEIEIAFYGGSFTAIPMDMQTEYLRAAHKYIEAGKVSKLHLSTRPDCIDKKILDNLKKYDVDTIELGVQSFDDEVLRLSKRGHDSSAVIKSAALIKDYGFSLGIQLMIGLPGDSLKACIYSAQETVKLKPKVARLYPTLVIDGTELYDMYQKGSYKALSRDEALLRTKEMYRILHSSGINIMRIGLKSTDIIGNGSLSSINGGTYHPAFRQLVEGEIAYEDIKDSLKKIQTSLQDILKLQGDTDTQFQKNLSQSLNSCSLGQNDSKQCQTPQLIKIDILSHPQSFSNMIGNRGINKKRLQADFPRFDIKYGIEKSLKKDSYLIKIKNSNQVNYLI